MILEELEIENVGIYAGLHRFKLAPDPEENRPVTLIKGHNGGGKSTFLEALRLVLYGKRSLGTRVSQSQYDAYLVGKIHATPKKVVARIVLKLGRVEEGTARRYEICRSWVARGASVVESFELARDGAVVPALPREDWERYVEDLVPSGVSQLFFFDAEKVQNIAEAATSEELRDSMRRMLGLDLIEQLRVDLTLYMGRSQRNRTDINLEALQREREDVSNAIRIAEEERAEISSQRDQVLRRAFHAERAFRNDGGRSAKSRDVLQESLKENKREREHLLQALKAGAGDILPLTLAPSTVKRLRRVVKAARIRLDASAIAAFIDRFEAKARQSGVSPDLWSERHFVALRDFIGTNRNSVDVCLDAGPDFIIRRLDRLNEGREEEMQELADALDRNFVEFSTMKEQIEGFDEGLLHEALEELKRAEHERGGIEGKLRQQDQAIQGLRKRQEALETEWRRSMQAVLHRAREDSSRDVATRARSAMDEYAEALLEARLGDLKCHFVDCFNRLIRKSNLVKTVEVDKETFDVTLIDSDDKVVTRESLSSGERQILAISMLWALGKASGHSLPMVMDGPFARLDNRHRRAVIEDYVTSASHQVILLCTDTEMTSELEQMVMPHVSAAYELNVPEGARSTTSAPVFDRHERDSACAYQ